jgi:hypothetical protein
MKKLLFFTVSFMYMQSSWCMNQPNCGMGIWQYARHRTSLTVNHLRSLQTSFSKSTPTRGNSPVVGMDPTPSVVDSIACAGDEAAEEVRSVSSQCATIKTISEYRCARQEVVR